MALMLVAGTPMLVSTAAMVTVADSFIRLISRTRGSMVNTNVSHPTEATAVFVRIIIDTWPRNRRSLRVLVWQLE